MTVPWRLVWSAGNATLTTVLSMKAMLEPRIVAARIQRSACAVHGAPISADRSIASSQGGFMKVADAHSCGIDSGGTPVASQSAAMRPDSDGPERHLDAQGVRSPGRLCSAHC